MKKHSTLIYFVNGIETEKKSHLNADESANALLTKMDIEPSERSIEKILSFAKSYEVLETESAGYAELNLN